MQPSILVTGAQGFIGRYVVSSLLHSQAAAQVIGVGRSKPLCGCFSHAITGPSGAIPAPLPDGLRAAFESSGRYMYHAADILDSEQITELLKQFRPQQILHLASGLRGDPRKCLFDINVEGTARLFEAVGGIKDYRPLIVLGSTGGVYGETTAERLPVSETSACNPIDEYSISKLCAELLAQMLARRFGLKLRIARMFNVIGAGQDERHVAGQIAAELLQIKLGQQQQLKLGTLSTTRDFVDVRDIASGLSVLLQEGVPDGLYNIASSIECSIRQLLETFFSVSGMVVELTPKQLRVDDISRQVADIKRIAALGFKPEFDLKSSVSSVWSYYESLKGVDR